MDFIYIFDNYLFMLMSLKLFLDLGNKNNFLFQFLMTVHFFLSLKNSNSIFYNCSSSK